jgi:hypothetical protein
MDDILELIGYLAAQDGAEAYHETAVDLAFIFQEAQRLSRLIEEEKYTGRDDETQ